MWWAVWCIAMVVGSTSAVPAIVYDNALVDPIVYRRYILSSDDSIPMSEHSMDSWTSNGVSGRRYDAPEDADRTKRGSTTLSIDMPMRLLRDKLNQIMNEKIRASNREFLNAIGKRGKMSLKHTLSELREEHTRPKRKMPSLSINNPMEVLRQRLMLEVARKQMREANQRQAFANRLFLQNVGKRGYMEDRVPTLYSN